MAIVSHHEENFQRSHDGRSVSLEALTPDQEIWIRRLDHLDCVDCQVEDGWYVYTNIRFPDMDFLHT